MIRGDPDCIHAYAFGFLFFYLAIIVSVVLQRNGCEAVGSRFRFRFRYYVGELRT